MGVVGLDNFSKPCELCTSTGGEILWTSPECRVVRVADDQYPGFCRVIWTAHVREMTDLEPNQRLALMQVVFAVEDVVRRLFKPHKINLASFGNMVPHLHWHIIPRWLDDRHFPEPIWGTAQREGQLASSQIDNVDNVVLSSALGRALDVVNKDGIFHGH
jgi:diadenosine tetraphosphate (Ap4A) HIT family hydrolase